MIPIAKVIHESIYNKVVAVMGAQMSKTETMANCIGCKLDDDPEPILYIAPTRSFVESVFEPRLRMMLMQCESLSRKRKQVKRERKVQKEVAGVKVRLAWAGSATEMSGDPACKVFVDERDRMEDNVEGEGDPVELADARHSTYPNGQTVIFSTPTIGAVETVVINGLEFWDYADEIESATWKIFQEGTRYHWAIPCPDCKDYFIPRFKLLWWPENSTPTEAHKKACLMCAHCGVLIKGIKKDELHQRGVFVAPGQTVTPEGDVQGKPPNSSTCSFWVSGLMSPWKSWGDRAQKFLEAVRSGDPERIQAVINTGFGELYSVAGEAPDLSLVRQLRLPYKLGEVHPDTLKLTLGVDVQKNRLVYSVRAWGADLESWHVSHGELMGNTDEDDVWRDLATLRDKHYEGKPIERCFIDSGYRTQFVYAFCRQFPDWALPTKGRDTIESAPLSRSKLDVASKTGRRMGGGLGIWHLNTDFFKRWLQERFERDPTLPGGWHLAEDTTEEFCKSMVSEARLVKPSGRIVWVLIHKNNHYFDCEVNNLACAYSLNLQMMSTEHVKQQRIAESQARKSKPQAEEGSRPDPFRGNVPKGSRPGWFNR